MVDTRSSLGCHSSTQKSDPEGFSDCVREQLTWSEPTLALMIPDSLKSSGISFNIVNLPSPIIKSTLGLQVMMVTEYMQGGDLGTALANDKSADRRLGWYNNGSHIVLEIARGLAYLHHRKVLQPCMGCQKHAQPVASPRQDLPALKGSMTLGGVLLSSIAHHKQILYSCGLQPHSQICRAGGCQYILSQPWKYGPPCAGDQL